MGRRCSRRRKGWRGFIARLGDRRWGGIPGSGSCESCVRRTVTNVTDRSSCKSCFEGGGGLAGKGSLSEKIGQAEVTWLVAWDGIQSQQAA